MPDGNVLGTRLTFTIGRLVFVVASVACRIAPDAGALVARRLVQGVGEAVVMAASVTLIRRGYPNDPGRARAVAIWAMGGAVAATAGPFLGGLLSLTSWLDLLHQRVSLSAQPGPARRHETLADGSR